MVRVGDVLGLGRGGVGHGGLGVAPRLPRLRQPGGEGAGLQHRAWAAPCDASSGAARPPAPGGRVDERARPAAPRVPDAGHARRWRRRRRRRRHDRGATVIRRPMWLAAGAALGAGGTRVGAPSARSAVAAGAAHGAWPDELASLVDRTRRGRRPSGCATPSDTGRTRGPAPSGRPAARPATGTRRQVGSARIRSDRGRLPRRWPTGHRRSARDR